MNCQDCGHSWTGPGYDQDINPTSCPNCGSYRTQVPGTNSEFQVRDTAPTAGSGLDDPGGNPLQEGIWGSTDGGWKNRMKRDESFASVREKIYLPWGLDTTKIAADFEVEQVIPAGPHTEEVDVGESNPLILQHDNPEVVENARERIEASHRTAFAFLAPLLAPLAEMGVGAIAGTAARTLGPGLVSGLVRGAVGGGGAAPSAPQPVSVPSTALSALRTSFHDILSGAWDNHPSTDQELGERADGDPEDVDAHEVNDGDHSEWQNDPEVNDQGGTDSLDGLTPEAESALTDAAPALIHYFNSEDSGHEDPAIKHLVEILERDHPGLIDQEPSAEEQQILDALKSGGKGPITAAQGTGMVGVPGIGGASPAAVPQPPVGPQSVNPMTQTNCPHCGAVVNGPVCSQCNGAVNVAPNAQTEEQRQAYPSGAQPYPTQPGVIASYPTVHNPTANDDVLQRLLGQDLDPHQQAALNVAMALRNNNIQFEDARERSNPLVPEATQQRAASQGPQSIEQIRAVAEIVGMDKLQDIIQNPDQYADVLAQIAGRDDPPTPDPSPAPPPPMPDPSQMGGMGMPPGGMPPGGGMPMQASADNLAPACPNCGSHTTGIESDDGHCNCSRCGNTWKPSGEVRKQVDMPATASRQSFDHAELHPHVDAQGVPAADQSRPDDPSLDQNPGSWTTSAGQPLKVGSQYEMYTANYDIPDIVRIESIKPDEIEYTLTGEYNLSHRTSVDKEEAQMDGITFVPVGGEEAPDSNLNEEQPPDQMQPPNMAPSYSIQGLSKTAAPDPSFHDVHYVRDWQHPSEQQRNQAYLDAEKIYREQGWDAAKEFLLQAADQHWNQYQKPLQEKYEGVGGLGFSHPEDYWAKDFGQRMHEEDPNGGAPSMWKERDMGMNLGGGAPISEHAPNWNPGNPGNILATNDGFIHTWDLPHNASPQEINSLGHSSYLKNNGYDTSAPFQSGTIDPNGGVEWHGLMDDPQRAAQLTAIAQQVHPELHENNNLGALDDDSLWGDDTEHFGAYEPFLDAQPQEAGLQGQNWDDGDYENCPNCGVYTKLHLGTCPHCQQPVRELGHLGKLAGKKFTPMEQREFIDEPGVARNSDKLDLRNTHYEEQASLPNVDDYFLW